LCEPSGFESSSRALQCPLREPLQLLAIHVAKHFVVDLRDESAGASELLRSLEPLGRNAALELDR
jgi:hypothetical protein